MRSAEQILLEARTIALVGASPDPTKPSHGVMRYLLRVGYRVLPVRPLDCDEVLGVPCVAVVWRGLGIGLGIAAWFTLVTELVPENYLSRVLSLDAFGSFALTPIGYVFAGALAGAFTPREIIAVGGTLGCMLWFVPLFYRSVRAAA